MYSLDIIDLFKFYNINMLNFLNSILVQDKSNPEVKE